MELIWVYLWPEHYPIQWSIFPSEDTPRLTSCYRDSASKEGEGWLRFHRYHLLAQALYRFVYVSEFEPGVLG